MKKFLILIFLLILINLVNAAEVDKEVEQELNENNEVEIIVYLKEQQGTIKYINYENVKVNIRKNSIKSRISTNSFVRSFPIILGIIISSFIFSFNIW